MYDNQQLPHWSYKEPIPEPPKEARTTYLIGHRKIGSTTQGETIKVEANPEAAASMEVTGIVHEELNRSYFRSWNHTPQHTPPEEQVSNNSDDLEIHLSKTEEDALLADPPPIVDDQSDLREIINKKKRKKQLKVLTQWITHTCSRCHNIDDMRISTMGTGMGERFRFTESRQVNLEFTESSSGSDADTIKNEDL